MLDGVSRTGVEVEARYYELSQKMVGHDFRRKRRAENPKAPQAPLMRF